MDTRETPYPPIKDYAIIGDCSSAALVSKHGSIDWLCWPEFSSPSVFGALLDQRIGGSYRIRPTGPYSVTRRYVGDTNVLETTFTTETGVLRLTDLMAVAPNIVYDVDLWPEHELLRALECIEGEVEVEVHFDPRFDYGRIQPRLERRGNLGYFHTRGSEVMVLRSEVPLTPSPDFGALSGTVTLQHGDRRYLALTYDREEPTVLPLLGRHARQRIEQTLDYWREWIGICSYDGPFRDAVVRSALTLKLLTFSLSGAVVAAPTTSLPEKIGGVRNWDYRFCWVRDAAFTLRALFELDYVEEGEAFLSWLLFAIGGTQPQLNVLYDMYGGARLTEMVLDHLEGYRHSRPVRVGNEAYHQLQLDIYGEVVTTAYEFVKRGGRLDREHRRLLENLGRYACNHWDEPDNGIWEIRSERKHHTYSKVMCWITLDRLIRMHEKGHVSVDVDEFRSVCDQIRNTVEERGYSREVESYVSVFEDTHVDASLLLLPIYGYVDAADPRMRATIDRMRQQLAYDSMILRYPRGTDDGLPPGEGAFGICSFWMIEYLAMLGKTDVARAHLENMLGYANDVGLFAEQIDPESGEALGNFPQAYTHVGLINAVLTIAEMEHRRRKSGLKEDMHEGARAPEQRTPKEVAPKS